MEFLEENKTLIGKQNLDGGKRNRQIAEGN